MTTTKYLLTYKKKGSSNSYFGRFRGWCLHQLCSGEGLLSALSHHGARSSVEVFTLPNRKSERQTEMGSGGKWGVEGAGRE
jgi:hypothetical protein